MTRSVFRWAVVVLALLRIAPAVAVLAANGRSEPGLPGYKVAPPVGDTYGFYAAAREFMSASSHLSKPSLVGVVLLLTGGAAGGALLWRRGCKGEAVALTAFGLGGCLSIAVHGMSPTGAGAVGWPILWSLPLFPLRVAHMLGYHGAFYLGVAVSLLCNVVTLVATALIARSLIPSRLALLAPAFLVAWPFLMRLIEGTGNIVYDSWLNDEGLLLYAEPLSTALVAAALALVILRRSEAYAVSLAGALLGFSAAVRLSNVTIVPVTFVLLLATVPRRSVALFVAAFAGAGSVAVEFWPRGYQAFHQHSSLTQTFDGLFSWHYLLRSWRDSAVFDWKMMLILLPLAAFGVIVMRQRDVVAWVLAGVVAATAAFYSPYYITALHPRFLFVALPSLFVLITAGGARLVHIADKAGTGSALRLPRR